MLPMNKDKYDSSFQYMLQRNNEAGETGAEEEEEEELEEEDYGYEEGEEEEVSENRHHQIQTHKDMDGKDRREGQ